MGVATYASWDPGGSTKRRTTGLCYWDQEANVLDLKIIGQKEFDYEIEHIPNTVKTFILEEYVPRRISHIGNRLLTAQLIGDIKGYARRHDIQIVEQPSTILSIAAMWAQVNLKSNKHLPDYISAYLHGYYYLFNKGLIKPKVLEDYNE